jgi:hypothetical protein
MFDLGLGQIGAINWKLGQMPVTRCKVPSMKVSQGQSFN